MRLDEVVENAWTRPGARCERERGLQGGPVGHWIAPGEAPQKGARDARLTGHPSLGDWESVKGCAIVCWACFQEAHGTLRGTKRTAPARPLSPLRNGGAGQGRPDQQGSSSQ